MEKQIRGIIKKIVEDMVKFWNSNCETFNPTLKVGLMEIMQDGVLDVRLMSGTKLLAQETYNFNLKMFGVLSEEEAKEVCYTKLFTTIGLMAFSRMFEQEEKYKFKPAQETW